ncbi:hypothetical protein NSP_21970 [Nodularia spumigena CCY9414]|nr:hypothetical protein NSP_21970 [Nodularia spumigena CCY9414]
MPRIAYLNMNWYQSLGRPLEKYKEKKIGAVPYQKILLP